MAQLHKCVLIVLACLSSIVAFSYLFTTTSSRNPVSKRSPASSVTCTELPTSLPLMSHVHPQNPTQLLSFKETFIAFPWNEFEVAVAKNYKADRQQFAKLLIDELTYFIKLEPFVRINDSCQPPPLPSVTEVDCKLYPNAFSGVKRNHSVRIGALLQFGFDVDVLEIHLNELYGVVDMFFIIESTHAHYEGIKKPLLWEHVQRQDRFLKFPVVHFIIDDAEFYQSDGKMWSIEQTQERLRWEKFLEWNDHTKYFGDDDVIGFGDADEIASRTKMNMFKYCEMKGAVDFGIWFPFGHIDQAFRSDYPIKGHPYTLGDPTYYTLAAAKKSSGYPNRKRGRSGRYMLGGIHMTHYGYLPFQLVKYTTATESHMQKLELRLIKHRLVFRTQKCGHDTYVV